MALPKVQFKEISSNLETDMIWGFIFKNKRGWSRWIFKKHPKLKDVLNSKGENSQVAFIRNYILTFKKEHKKDLLKSKKKYELAWKKVKQRYFDLLSKILDTDWPKDHKNITVLISINPICPRFLNDWGFSIFYDYKQISHVLEVIMHETCHFLYFKKWLELYPATDKKKFESPYIEWHLSELVAPIILNDKRVQTLLKQKAVFYPEYSKIKINGNVASTHFTEIYKNSEGDFKKFLSNSFKSIKIHRHLFN